MKKQTYIALTATGLILVGGAMFAAGARWRSEPAVSAADESPATSTVADWQAIAKSALTTTPAKSAPPVSSPQSVNAMSPQNSPDAQTQAQDFQLQTECSAQAEKFLATTEQGYAESSSFSQVNYYNPIFGECFVLIDFSSTLGLVGPNDVANDEEIDDPFTGQQFAMCTQVYNDGQPLGSGVPRCVNAASGYEMSYQDYLALGTKLMGTVFNQY